MGSGKHKSKAEAAPREVELKLTAEPEAIDRLLGHAVMEGAEPAPDAGGSLHAIYFDTDDQTLRHAGLSARIRRKGEAWIQTVKAERDEAGLVLDRDEWESPVAGESLDLEAAKGSALADLLDGNASLAARLRPAFTVRTERRAYHVARDGALVELVLDRAEIAAGDRTLSFGEVELELKRGEPPALFHLALDLAEAAPLRLSLATKSARGYALLAGGTTEAVKAERIDLARGLAAGEAFRRIARSCLAQALRNEAILRDTGAPAALHQMRVGLRRLRAAISLFKDLFGDPESGRMREELRWYSHALGPARDLDVLTERLRGTPETERAPDHDARAAEAEARRQTAHRELAAFLDTPRARRVPLAAAAWIEAGAWLASEEAGAAREQPIEERARAELKRRRKRVLARAADLADLDPEARHRVRIEIKKLRYGAEFFGRLFKGGSAKQRRKAMLEGLAALQELLGELNDIAVGGQLAGAGETAPDPAGEAATAPDLMPPHPAEESSRAPELLARAEREVRRLAEVKPFWR